MVETITKILGTESVIITVVMIMIIAFARCITKIFRMGATFKTNLVTKEEQQAFEEEIRRDMRGYAVQIQKSVSDAMMTVLNNRLKDIDDAKNALTEIKITKAEIDMKTREFEARANEIQELSATVKKLSMSMQRLEFNQMNTKTNSIDRRTE